MRSAMGHMSIVMAPPQTGVGVLVGGRTQGVVRGLGEDSPGQEHLPSRGGPPKYHNPRL